jgi:hypothetical protein
MFLSARTPLVVSAFDWLCDPFNLCTPRAKTRRPRTQSAVNRLGLELSLAPSTSPWMPNTLSHHAASLADTGDGPFSPAPRHSSVHLFHFPSS